MHELSIAMSLVDVAVEEAHLQGGARVLAIHLKLGRLCGVVPEALSSAFELAREGTELEGCALVIDEVPIVIDCQVCRAPRPAQSIQNLCCDVCGTPSMDLISGRELELFALEVAEPAPA